MSNRSSTLQPSYLNAYHSGRLQHVATALRGMLSSCRICPRQCRVNRLEDERGFCATGRCAEVYSFMAHHGEEPPLSGERGSGTIFFGRCNMRCAYCQNYEFSQEGQGARRVEDRELAAMMLELQGMGCHNINVVSPTHVLPQIVAALVVAAENGLTVPLVYNTGGYELPGMIALLEGTVDVYLPDMRYADDACALRYSDAPGYTRYNQESVKEMHRQVGIAKMNKLGIIEKGLIVRHLVLPDGIAGTPRVMQYIAKELSPETYVSLMSQYFPCYRACGMPELSRRISLAEYAQAKQDMEEAGLHNGWVQDDHGLDRFAGIHIKPNA